jgi:crossover junction endodeoxyribonuclease RuvC
MIVIGIDPGIATTGFGVIEKIGSKLKLIDYGVISTPAHTPLSRRLGQLAAELRGLIGRTTPVHMAVEELFFNTNAKTALIVAQARGVILLVGEETGLPVYGYTPIQVKLGVSGYGRADKNQVQQMVKQLLNLDKIPKPDDAADALAIAICHAHSVRLKSLA